MSTPAIDRLLAVLIVAMAATGLATLRAGHPSGAWLYVVHGLLAGGLAGIVLLKLRRSVPAAIRHGRYGRLGLALLVSAAVAAALTGGWLWVASGELVWIDTGVFGRWTILTIHAWIGLAVVPLVVLHLLPRRWRLLRPGPGAAGRAAGRLLNRRALLAGGLLAIAGGATFISVAALERLRGGQRRFTGSRWLDAGGIPPPTTFFGEPPPPLAAADWRVEVHGRVARPRRLALDELRAVGETERTAVLDCTSGWAIETSWRGVTGAALLDACGAAGDAREVTVRSATGWTAVLPIDEARGCLLAWAVAGAPLPEANGAPLRLVVPDRRGLDWVKWVTEVRVG